jgi:hypothetical protein
LQLDEFSQRGIDGLFLGFELAELDGLFDEGVVEMERCNDETPPNANAFILQSGSARGKRWLMRRRGAKCACAALL